MSNWHSRETISVVMIVETSGQEGVDRVAGSDNRASGAFEIT